MKVLVATTITLLMHLQLQGQSLSPFVIGSAGALFDSPNGSIAWTIGEPVTATFKTTNFLTQGFHQPATILVTGISLDEDESVVVYPNPVRDILHVRISQPDPHQIEMFNLQGQRLVNDHAVGDGSQYVHRVDVLEIPVALYILRTTNLSTGAVYYHKIEKH